MHFWCDIYNLKRFTFVYQIKFRGDLYLNIFDAITTMAGVKKFDKRPVDDKLIGVMLYMANEAPSAGNI